MGATSLLCHILSTKAGKRQKEREWNKHNSRQWASESFLTDRSTYHCPITSVWTETMHKTISESKSV